MGNPWFIFTGAGLAGRFEGGLKKSQLGHQKAEKSQKNGPF